MNLRHRHLRQCPFAWPSLGVDKLSARRDLFAHPSKVGILLRAVMPDHLNFIGADIEANRQFERDQLPCVRIVVASPLG